MAVFEYKALNANGKQVKGLVESDSARTARTKLKQQGIFPTSLVESNEQVTKKSFSLSFLSAKRTKVPVGQLAVVSRQLSTLLAAGMPLVDALRALADQIDTPHFKTVIAEITDLVNEGSTVAQALGRYPRIFPRLYVNMVASAEASGSLDIVLERLADLLDAQAALRRKVLSALTYPVMMLVLCVGVVILMLAVVVPQITAIFEEKGGTLPLPTRVIIALSNFMQSYWWVIVGGVTIAVISIQRFYRTPEGRKRVDALLLRSPLIGPLLQKVAASRFSRNVGAMLASGIEVLQALSLARNILGNAVMEEAISEVSEKVREGGSLARELERTKLFPRLLIHMTAIGEKTGQLSPMLLRAAASYESEVDAFVSGLTSILEPVLIIFLAGIVGGILAAVMLPMLEMTSLTGV